MLKTEDFLIWICIPFLLLFILLSGCEENTKSEYDKEILVVEYQKYHDEAKKMTDGKLSLPYSLKALEIAGQLNDKERTTNSLTEVSHDYERMGELDKALEYSLDAIKIYEKQNDEEGIALVYNRIGTLFFKQGDSLLHYGIYIDY